MNKKLVIQATLTVSLMAVLSVNVLSNEATRANDSTEFTAEEMIEALKGSPFAEQQRESYGGLNLIIEGSEPPTISLAITFEFDSADLTEQGRILLNELAAAVKSETLVESRFLIAGHTDARGDPRYNLDLSKKRAVSVIHYLSRYHGISAERFDAAGYGSTKLVFQDRPFDRRNRRVEITRLDLSENLTDANGKRNDRAGKR